MRILIVSDAWYPQVNGVVRTLDNVAAQVRALGHHVDLVTPSDFPTLPCPTYPEIRLAVCSAKTVGRQIAWLRPDALHIATEGPLGLAARRYCVQRGFRFTTAFHTKFPDYVRARTRIPVRWSYKAVRWFHAPSSGVLVATQSIREELAQHGLKELRPWSRGVDAELFRPGPKDGLPYARPIFLYVGRLSIEKNVDAFLSLDLPGTKLVVGNGPEAERLQAKFPLAVFVGWRTGKQLAATIAASNVMVFPSKTDTFGLVLLEALACGIPVAAYPVPGPLDVLGDASVGSLDWDLARAARNALQFSPDACRSHAVRFTWESTARSFLNHLVPIAGGVRSSARRDLIEETQFAPQGSVMRLG